jgi:hypothetical protein
MAESRSSSLFCAFCGTVSVVEGNCPQCFRPLRRLGKVGAIVESKRATQQLINDENYKAALAGSSVVRNSIRRTQSLMDREEELNMYL